MAAHTAQRMRSKVTAEAILQHLHRAWMYARLMIVCLHKENVLVFFGPETNLREKVLCLNKVYFATRTYRRTSTILPGPPSFSLLCPNIASGSRFRSEVHFVNVN